MKNYISLVLLCMCGQLAHAQSPYGKEPLAHTYSIVAYDPATGEMGAAVQSHWFGVGNLVIWGEAGTGVVATQSFVNPAFGPEGIKLMREGMTARKALEQLIDADEGRAYRQVALLDAKGEAYNYTGEKCIAAAGHLLGKNYAVQANLMDNSRVWIAMAEAFEAAEGKPLAERLVIAMEAAQSQGGDIRGQQSAALLVVGPENTGKVWEDVRVDLKVDDHPAPLTELRRLLNVKRAYDHMNQGDLAMEAGDTPKAMQEYGAAQALYPDNLEMKFWHAIALANAGQVEKALPIFEAIFKKSKNWKKLTPRLVPNGLLSVEKEDLEKILKLP